MKIYAKQIAPEYQESPLYYGDFPENVHIYGNRHYNEHGNYTKTFRALEELGDDVDSLRHGCGWNTGESLESLLQYYFPRENPYSRAERLRVLDIVAVFWEYRLGSDEELTAILEIMEMRDGIKYEAGTIRGCCQGDWQNIIYPAKYGPEWLNQFEAEYFNTGTEWIIHDGETEPDGPEDIDGYSCYCYTWSPEALQREIANIAGCPDADVVLYEYAGNIITPKYREVV